MEGLEAKSGVSMAELAKMYMFVSQCWQDPDMAVKENMSVSRALRILRHIQMYVLYKPNGFRLSRRSEKLLMEIVNFQEEPQEFQKIEEKYGPQEI